MRSSKFREALVTQTDLVSSIGDSITALDVQLKTLDPTSAQWQTLYAQRKHLNDQQCRALEATLKDDDVQFQTAAGVIKLAVDQLNQEIAAGNRVDDMIATVSQISASLDQILKQV
jgi:hypothetical protein